MDIFIKVLDGIIYLALAFALIEVYLKVNKIWKRKHEKEVAESQSLFGLGLSLFILIVWSIKYLIQQDYASIVDNGIYLIETVVMIFIGTGLFVKENKGKKFLKLILQAIKLERKEATYLLNSLSGKKEAQDIINILHQLAWIDNDLDKNELKMIKDFAKAWNIEYDEKDKNLPNIPNEFSSKLQLLRNSLLIFLEGRPNKEQIAQLSDLLKNLINADRNVSEEEDIIFDELSAILNNYISENKKINYFHVLIVPQEKSHIDLIKQLRPNAEEVHTSGGIAFSLEKYLSGKYAEQMCQVYREQGLFTIVENIDNENKS
jgi:hypothetical protein